MIKKWKNEIFSKILKIGTFTKTQIKFSVFKIFSPNFFYKIWMECRYEKCPKIWFLLKNWSNYEHVKHAKIKKTPCIFLNCGDSKDFVATFVSNVATRTFWMDNAGLYGYNCSIYIVSKKRFKNFSFRIRKNSLSRCLLTRTSSQYNPRFNSIKKHSNLLNKYYRL